MEILVFGKPSCAKCRTTKSKLSHLLNKWGVVDSVQLTYYDLETIDGMTEGAFRDVMGMPTVIVDNGKRELSRWTGVVPNSNEVRKTVAAK